MAIPLILPLLFSAGSALANTIGANRAASAREDALAAERIRQSALDDQTFGLADAARKRFEDTRGEQTQRRDSLADMFAAPAEQMRPTAPMLPKSDNIAIQQRNVQSSNEAAADVDQRAGALANYRSFADLFGDRTREAQRDAGGLDQLFGFKRGSQAALPMELDAAAQEGAGARALGDLFGLGVQATTGPALAGSAFKRPPVRR